MDSEDPHSATIVPLSPGVKATISCDEEKGWVYLSIADAERTAPVALQIPAQQASDLAVALVNAANGL
ncbi:MAG: hypothetical protein M3203_08780 [Actinomycetota bacterium]|nr:hypothetical protein [Actinomycetota bacterium]